MKAFLSKLIRESKLCVIGRVDCERAEGDLGGPCFDVRVKTASPT